MKVLKQARLGNITLVPASMLPFKEQWEQIAAGADGGVLFIVPEGETPLRMAMRWLVPLLRAHGRRVTALAAERLDQAST